MKLLLITDRPELREDVHACLGPTDELQLMARGGIVDERLELSAYGQEIVQNARDMTAVLVDWTLEQAPSLNALSHAMRVAGNGPNIMLCPPGERPDALVTGGDVALSLPVDAAEIEALAMAYRRIVQVTTSAVRRAAGVAEAGHTELSFGDLRLDTGLMLAAVGASSVRLTPRETALLSYLIRRQGSLCTRSELLEHVWDIRFDTGTNMVDVFIYFVRRKLEALGLHKAIETIRGGGYRLVKPDRQEPDRMTTGLPSYSAR